MPHFTRWWETLGRAERLVALAIGLSAPIAIINSTVWAIAVMYMTHARSQVAIERLRAQAARGPALDVPTGAPATAYGADTPSAHIADRQLLTPLPE